MFIFGSTYNNMDSSLAMPNEVITNHSDLEFFFLKLCWTHPLHALSTHQTNFCRHINCTVLGVYWLHLLYQYTGSIIYIIPCSICSAVHMKQTIYKSFSQIVIQVTKSLLRDKKHSRDGNQMGKYSSNTCIFQTHNLPVQCHNLRYNGIRLQTVPYIETVIVV